MAKISNTLSYPNQSPIVGADYLIGTAATSSPIDKQTKTFTIQGIADYVIDAAFDGVSYRLPIFTAASAGQESVLLVNSLLYQDTASLGGKPSEVLGTTVYLNNGSGVGSLDVAQSTTIGTSLSVGTNATVGGDATITGKLTVNGDTDLGADDSTQATIESVLSLQGPIKDSTSTVGNTEQVLVSDGTGKVHWENFQGSGLEFQGGWNASTNVPDLQNFPLTLDNTGKYWVVSDAGTTPLTTTGGGTITDWESGDWAIVSEDLSGNVFWDKIDNSSVLTGAGTPNTLAMWTGTTVLGDSTIYKGTGSNDLRFNVTSNTASGGFSNAFGANSTASANTSFAAGDSATASGSASAAFGSTVQATGQASFAVGSGTIASGLNTFAAGKDTEAIGQSSFAMGGVSKAVGKYSIAIGNGCKANSENSVSLGFDNDVTGVSAVAMGDTNTVNGVISFVVGGDNVSSTDGAIILGKGNAVNTNARGIAIGITNTVTGDTAIALGSSNVSSGEQSLAVGVSTQATGDWSFAQGKGSTATNDNAISAGYQSVAAGADSLALGKDNTSSGSSSVSIGRDNSSTGQSSIAIGETNKADLNYSIAIGQLSESTAVSAIAIGSSAKATFGNAIAIGESTTSSGGASVAIGKATVATGLTSFASGSQSTATGISSTAMGENSSAVGNYTFAAGFQADTNGTGAVSIGYNTEAGADYSVAIGSEQDANDIYGIAIGHSSNISGQNAIGIGNNLEGRSYKETVLGSFNAIASSATSNAWIASDRLFTIGNGVSTGAESNALVILKSGSLSLPAYGSGNIIGTPVRNLSVDVNGNVIETAIGSAGITGTGTATYIPVWDSASSITDSIMFQTAAGIGIGTTNPVYDLNASITGKIASNSVAFVQVDTGQNLINVGDIDANGNSLSLRDETGSQVALVKSGNISIGLGGAANEKLEVNGNIKLSASGDIYTDGDELRLITGGNNVSNTGLLIDEATKTITTDTNSSVGVGVSSPQAKLDVDGGIKMGDTSVVPSASNAGTLRYRVSGNNSYIDIIMQDGPASFSYVNIVQKNW